MATAVRRPSCARSLLGKVPDTTPTRGRETTVGPSENAFLKNYNCWICARVRRNEAIGFAFAQRVNSCAIMPWLSTRESDGAWLITAAGYRPYSIDKKAIYKRIKLNHDAHAPISQDYSTQLRLLEIVEFPVEATSLFPLVACVFMQCEGVAMHFEARRMKIRRCGTLSAFMSGTVVMICYNVYLTRAIRAPYDGRLYPSDGTYQILIWGHVQYTLTVVLR
jgi:hypothetical protein